MNPKRPGSYLATLVIACLLSSHAAAGLFASMDRYRIAMGDTVRLTLRSDDERDPADADLRGLQEHFEILQQSSSVSTRIINGERSQNRELVLELTPRREGSVVIPPFVVDGVRSEALAVDIGPEPQSSAGDEIATFEAELDRSNPYVQGQLLLTLRVQQAVNMESRSITELEIDNAYVEALGQNSFQRTINGRPWLVHEIRYAIFPETSGELLIPAQTFSGRLGSGRRTLFDTRSSGRLIRRQTEELRVNVRPRPADYPASTWLPASDLIIEEQWSAALDELQVGDSITRTITMTGEGMQGAQLPPVEKSDVAGLRVYPDQPSINNVTSDTGITGIRSDSIALVAVSAGDYELPAVEIPWWDTNSDSLRVARLPARRIRVVAPPTSGTAGTAGGTDLNAATAAANADLEAPASADAGPWPYVAALCAAGWLLTTLLLLRRRTAAVQPKHDAMPKQASTRDLLQACKANDAARAREALTAWLTAQAGDLPQGSWLRHHGSADLQTATAELDEVLYGPGAQQSWDGQRLAGAIKAHTGTNNAATTSAALPELYVGDT